MLLRVRLCARADTRVHGHIAATHVPGSVCVNAHAHGAHPRSAHASTQAHTHLVPAPTASSPPPASEPLRQFPAGAQSHRGPRLGGGQRDSLLCIRMSPAG